MRLLNLDDAASFQSHYGSVMVLGWSSHRRNWIGKWSSRVQWHAGAAATTIQSIVSPMHAAAAIWGGMTAAQILYRYISYRCQIALWLMLGVGVSPKVGLASDRIELYREWTVRQTYIPRPYSRRLHNGRDVVFLEICCWRSCRNDFGSRARRFCAARLLPVLCRRPRIVPGLILSRALLSGSRLPRRRRASFHKHRRQQPRYWVHVIEPGNTVCIERVQIR